MKASIRKCYRDLRPTQRRIADYLLSLDFAGLNAPIGEYARRIGTSIASISRFCSRIGCDGFQQLKIGLSREMQEPGEVVVPPIFAAGDDAELSIRKVFAEAIDNLQATESAVSFPALISAAERIVRSERLYFLGLGGSGGVSALGEVMFSGLGFNAKALSDPYAMLVCAGHLRKGQVVFGLSHSGDTREVLEAMAAAKERGAYTVGITNYPHSRLAAMVHAPLLTSCREHRVHFAHSNSMAAQLTLIRAIYILVASGISPEALHEVNRIEQTVNQSLRLKIQRKEPARHGTSAPARG